MRGTANRSLVTTSAIAAVLVATSIGSVQAQSAQTARMPALADYYRLESIGSPAISPDGNRVAFVRTLNLADESRGSDDVAKSDVTPELFRHGS